MRQNVEQWAPIALFVYKRPEHTRRTIRSLLACDGADRSRIHVFADGPRNEAEISAVSATRAVARELLGSDCVFTEQANNRGLAESVIAGTTELCDRYGASIVVEDDLVLAPSFLRFLNEGLARYKDEPRVMQVSGYMFDVPALMDQREGMFLPFVTSWGWATWKRAWDLFDPFATGWRERLDDRTEARRFNLDGAYDYRRMLKRQMSGEIDSWAIRWYYSVFDHEGLALFPPRTLVSNEGHGRGTHGRLPVTSHQALYQGSAFDLPTDIAVSADMTHVFDALRAFRRFSWRRLGPLLRHALPGTRRS